MAYNNFSQNNTKTNVQFFSGLQADLNDFIKGNQHNGTSCIEGAFYLTTDTQRLYVGRKNSTDNKIYAVQVSKGITFVHSSGDLPTSTTEFEEGELYYVTTTNVLAALREKLNDGVSYNPKQYEWVQINPPTGITSINGNAVTDNNDVIVNTTVATQGGNKTGKTKFVAGTNVHLTANGNETIDSIQSAKLTINADDTTYTLGTTATSNEATDGATIKLNAAFNGTADSTKDSSISISGSNTVAVTSNADGNIDVKGPSFSAVSISNSSTNGFQIGITGTDGDGNNLVITKGNLQPKIKYGQSGTTKTNGVAFQSGAATLDIYTKAETDTAIDNAIKAELATADALTYCGTIGTYTDENNASNNRTFAEDFRRAVIANGGLHNGDVYKISQIGATDTSISTIDGVTPDAGDLIIIYGVEDSTTGQIKIGNHTVDTSATPYTANTNYNIEGILAVCELVPSGDEPEVVAAVNVNSTSTNPHSFQLKDGKNNANTNILTTSFQGTNKILVTAQNDTSVTTGKKMDFTVSHAATTRTNANNGSLSTGTATDSIGTGKKEFYVLPAGASDLSTDDYGHVNGLTCAKVTLAHNTVTKLTAAYGTGDNNGLITIDRTDSINSGSLAAANKANIKIKSSTLNLVGSNTSGSEGLSIDLVWQTF